MIHNKKAEKILNTTIRLFLRNGAKKVSMDDIAENAGVSKVTVYKYFSDKDTLFLEISRCIFSGYAQRLEIIPGSGRAFIEKLYDFIDVICDFTDSAEGMEVLKHYLFHGTQVQRNYCALYFSRLGEYPLVREAYDRGLVDAKQAFSR